MPNTAVTIVFTYTRNSNALTVKHVYDGAETVTKNAVATAYDSNVSETKIDREGFTFSKVESTVGDLTGEAVKDGTITGKMPDTAVTIVFTYARKSNLTVEVKYVEQGNHGNVLDTETLEGGTFEDEYEVDTTKTFSGYTYATTVDPNKGVFLDPSGTVYVEYIAKQYTITYNGNGATGTLTDPKSPYKYKTVVTVLDNSENGFSKTGYHFVGWNRVDDVEETPQVPTIVASEGENTPDYAAGDTFEMPANNVTLVAQWAPNTDTAYSIITYLQQNGTYPADGTAEAKQDGTTDIEKTIVPAEISGYTFDTAAANVLTAVIKGNGTTVFKLYYKKNYSITYQAGANGSFEGIASGVRKDLKFYGDSYSAAPTPVANSGYYFSGWTPALPGAEEKVTSDKTFSAYFALITNGGGGGSKDRDDKDDTTVKTVTVVDEEIPAGVPELNKEEHFQYLQGYPDNTVRPEGNITREEVAAVFYRLLTKEYRESIMTTSHNFPDVEKGRWSTKYIATLAKGGILEGDPDGKYRPGDFITKAELSVVASKFDKLSPFSGDMFKDISGHWANKYINSAAQKGWVKGNPDGTFNPDKYITRAEFATLVNNVLERRVHKEDILPGARKFPDLHETDWYYEAMMEAINSHYYERSQDGYEKWTEIYYPDLDL